MSSRWRSAPSRADSRDQQATARQRAVPPFNGRGCVRRKPAALVAEDFLRNSALRLVFADTAALQSRWGLRGRPRYAKLPALIDCEKSFVPNEKDRRDYSDDRWKPRLPPTEQALPPRRPPPDPGTDRELQAKAAKATSIGNACSAPRRILTITRNAPRAKTGRHQIAPTKASWGKSFPCSTILRWPSPPRSPVLRTVSNRCKTV